jgi:predicted metal-dependent phosphoesterase TrpH
VGTELSCKFLGRSLHVLGLLVNPEDATFQARLTELRGRREERNDRMIKRLTELGYAITREEIQAEADSPLLSRVHFAKALAKKGHVRRTEEAFERLIGDDGPAFVPREELSPSEASRWIREAGGVPIVAHPGRFAGGKFRWDDAMADLQRQGLEGLEAYYGEYRAAEQRTFLALAQRLGMVATGGSDYHGGNKPGIALGRGRGGLRVPTDLLSRLEEQQRRGSSH